MSMKHGSWRGGDVVGKCFYGYDAVVKVVGTVANNGEVGQSVIKSDGGDEIQ